MKALKFLAKTLIAALGVCVIVGALNYSGFSFHYIKWLDKDELLDNFIQDQFNDYIYDWYLSKFSRIDDCKKDIFYELDSNLTEIDILNKIKKILQNDNNQTKINIKERIRKNFTLNDISKNIISNKKIAWTLKDDNERYKRDNEWNRYYFWNTYFKINFPKDKNILIHYGWYNIFYIKNSYKISEYKNKPKLYDRLNGISKYCTYTKIIQFPIYEYKIQSDDFINTKCKIEAYLQNRHSPNFNSCGNEFYGVEILISENNIDNNGQVDEGGYIEILKDAIDKRREQSENWEK